MRSQAPGLSSSFGHPLQWVVAGLLGLASAGAAIAVPQHRFNVAVVAVFTIGAILSWHRPEGVAWIAGLLLPIQVIDGASTPLIEVLHIGVAGLIVLRFKASLTRPSLDLVLVLTGLLLALALARLGFGLAREPLGPTIRSAGLGLGARIVAVLVVVRVAAHRPLLLGYVAGVAVSGVVALLQAGGSDWVRTPEFGESRAPGLGLQPPTLSWHVATAVVIGLTALWVEHRRRARLLLIAQLLVSLGAFLVCGAQGGIVGLGAVIAVCVVVLRSDLRRMVGRRRHWIGWVGGVVVVAVAISVVLGLPSARGLIGDPEHGFQNEIARVDSIEFGIEQLVEEPLTGLGVGAYDERFYVRPHFIPLDASVTTGILGLAIGSALVGLLIGLVFRGPSEWTPSSVMGLALLTTMLVQALLTPSGPFASVERILILLVATATRMGGSEPFARSNEPRGTPNEPVLIATTNG